MSKEQRKRWIYICVLSGVFAFSLFDRQVHSMEVRPLGSAGILTAANDQEALRIKEEEEKIPPPQEIELNHFGHNNSNVLKYPLPEYSSSEKIFCRGYQTSVSCDRSAKHPIFESDKYYGVKLPTIEADRKFTYEIK